MPVSKLMNLSEAVSRFIPDGSSVALGTAQETLIPFAAGHEIIRQRRRNLTLIGPISDILFDQMIGAGCVSKVCAAWVGNVITGSGYNFRRAVESGRLEMEDHSILTLTAALTAAKMGVPYMPTRTALGSDLYRTNAGLKKTTCPFTGDALTAVRAVVPDVTIVHAQRADRCGRAHMWGNLGVTREACLAARRVIVTAEQIVPPETISSDPNRVVVPGLAVVAVSHVPWGAHPSPVPGHYNRDHRVFLDYRQASRTPQAFLQWCRQWVEGVPDREQYIRLLGEARAEALRPRHRLQGEPVESGY
jgi:glutaconate CoA-transferase subunit A